jgi:hypothetical protein
MRTSIQFSTRTLLIVSTLFLSLILVVVTIFFGLQRALPAQSYIYHSYGLEVTSSPPWHPGQTLNLLWVSNDVLSSDKPPPSVTCTFTLYGPYTTQADAQADQGGLAPEGGGVPLAASAPPLVLSTDVGAAAPTSVTYALPDVLAPGYYLVIAAANLGDSGGGASSSWVAEVAA